MDSRVEYGQNKDGFLILVFAGILGSNRVKTRTGWLLIKLGAWGEIRSK